MSQQPEVKTHQVYRPYKDYIPLQQTHMNQLYPNQTTLDLNQLVVKCFRHQTELTHSTQCLHQQTTDALNNKTRSSSHQENLHFINDIPIFKAKDPQSFGEWLEQIDKVPSLTNKGLYKLALAKSQGSFSRTISSYPPTLEWKRIKEQLCYNFSSVATKQHVASMLIKPTTKASETLQEYLQRFADLLLKSSGLLPNQVKDLAHIMPFYKKST